MADMINHIEWTRKQTEDLAKMLASDPKYADALKAAQDFEKKAIAAESKFVDVTLTGRTEDSFRAPMGLYGRLTNLGALLNGAPGQGASGADLPPTSQEVEVNNLYKQEIAAARQAFKELRDKEAPAFNAALRADHVSASIMP